MANFVELSSTHFFGDSNLVAYYKLENANDSKGSFNLTTKNTIAYVTGLFGNCLDLSASNPTTAGNSNCLYINNDLGITGGNSTFSFWAKSRSTSSTKQQLFDQGDSGNHVSLYLYYTPSSGAWEWHRVRSGGGGGDDSTSNTNDIGTTNWYHIAMTYDGTNLIGYINGSQAATVASSGNGSSGDNDNFGIGANTVDYQDGASFYIDDFAIFTRALSAAEIKMIADYPLAGFIFNLL